LRAAQTRTSGTETDKGIAAIGHYSYRRRIVEDELIASAIELIDRIATVTLVINYSIEIRV
jgi:hypothetical protein